MNTLKRAALAAVLTIAMILSGCNEKPELEYIPFQETEDGNWGMISPSGEVLFSEEFETGMITPVRDGRFFVINDNGYYEMYEATKHPKHVGDAEYVSTTGFRNGVAVVAEKNKHVSLIKPDGSTIKVIDKIEKKEVKSVSCYHDNYAIYQTVDTLFGLIGEKGNTVLKPEYCYLKYIGNDKYVSVKAKDKEQFKKNADKGKWSVIDHTGKKLFDYTGEKYKNIACFDKELFVVYTEEDDKPGIIDRKGKYIVKPNDKVNRIGSVKGDIYTCEENGKWGLNPTFTVR